MCQSPALMRVLASDRVADLGRLSESGVRDRRDRPEFTGSRPHGAPPAGSWSTSVCDLRCLAPR